MGGRETWLGIVNPGRKKCRKGDCDGHLEWVTGEGVVYDSILGRHSIDLSYDDWIVSKCSRISGLLSTTAEAVLVNS